MNRTSVDWAGPMPALTTPFRDDFTIDEAAFAANVDRLFEAGATGMVVAGCTGEFWALTLAERARLARVAAAAGRGRGPVIVGAGAIPRRRDRRSDPCREGGPGADGALVLPPLFRAPERPRADPALRDRRCAIGAAARALQHPRQRRERDQPGAGRPPSPISIGSSPSRRAVATGRASTTRCSACATGSASSAGLPRSSGSAATLAGADGLIDCFPNVWAPGCLDLWHATRAGRMREAWSLQRTGLALTELFTTGGRSLYPATKAAMDRLGFAGGGRPQARPSGRSRERRFAGSRRVLTGCSHDSRKPPDGAATLAEAAAGKGAPDGTSRHDLRRWARSRKRPSPNAFSTMAGRSPWGSGT